MRLRLFNGLLFMLASVFLLSACSEQNTGPANIKWDRDSCERCRMMLSDRQFSAQIRVFPKDKKRSQVKPFDDIGCATLWLETTEYKDDPKTEIWVRHYKSDAWIDAKTAWYVKGLVTPMAYGLGAQTEKVAGALNFEQAKKHIEEIEKKYNVHGGNYSH